MAKKTQTKSKANGTKRAKKSHGPAAYLGLNWPTLDRALTNLEVQAEKAYDHVKTLPTDLHKMLPKPWDRRLKNLTSKDVINFAVKQRDNVEHEVKRLADDIVHTLKGAHFLSKQEKLVKEARHNLEIILKKVRRNPMVIQAKDLAKNQGGQLLNILNVPTRKDISKLNSRLTQIEHRLTNISKGA